MNNIFRPDRMLRNCLRSGTLIGRKIIYPNLPKVKKTPRLSREEIRERRKTRLDNLIDPEISGERMPDFYNPARTKLFYRMLQDMRNCNKITRKPIPENLKKELAKKAKEYADYKSFEFNHIYNEASRGFDVKIETMKACLFLPEHLFKEISSDTTQSNLESMKGFNASELYLEQIMETYPREQTEKIKMSPPIGDELNKFKVEQAIKEKQNQGEEEDPAKSRKRRERKERAQKNESEE